MSLKRLRFCNCRVLAVAIPEFWGAGCLPYLSAILSTEALCEGGSFSDGGSSESGVVSLVEGRSASMGEL